MEIATLSSKGQITIPKSVREALNLQYGDKVVIQQEENGRFYFDNAAFVKFSRTTEKHTLNTREENTTDLEV